MDDKGTEPTMKTVSGEQHALLTVEQVGRMLNLSRTLLYEEMRRGRLRSVSIGRARRVPVDAVAAYLTLLGSEANPETTI